MHIVTQEDERMDLTKLKLAYSDVEHGRTTLDEILESIKQVPDKNAVSDSGDTLLHMAAEKLHLSAVQYLLESGCDPNAADSNGETPLIRAADQKHFLKVRPENTAYDVAKALLDAGAAGLAKDRYGKPSYLVAAKSGNGRFVKALHDKGVRITRTDDSGNNGIHLLIESLYNPMNNYRMYEERLKDNASRGMKQDILDADKRLVDNAKKEMDLFLNEAFIGVKAFLDGGVDPDDKNEMGDTSHILAERRGSKRIGALLRGEITGDDEKADSIKERAGGLTMVKAALKKDIEAIKALAELGADVNAVEDIYGYGEGTPLAAGCLKCDLETVELLLELGADPNAKTGNGTTPITWLREGDIAQTFKLNYPSKIIDAMAAAGMDINSAVNDRSDTLLLWALLGSSEMEVFTMRETLRWYIVKGAIAHKADVNKANIYGQTPLMVACAGDPGHNMRMADDIQVLLLENGANVASRDIKGNTPLIYAAGNSNAKAAKEMAENLFDYGDPQAGAVNNEGKSALDIAAEADNEMLVKFLLNNI